MCPWGAVASYSLLVSYCLKCTKVSSCQAEGVLTLWIPPRLIRDWNISLIRKGQVFASAQPPEETAEREPHQYINVCEKIVSKGWSQALLSGAKQWDKRLQTDAGTQEVPPEHNRELLYSVDEHTLEHVAQSSKRSLPHWSYSKAAWTQS